MKKLKQQLLRFGVITLTLGAFSVAQADTQAEKGNAGDGPGISEKFDCRKDKWVCTHLDAMDSDLLCFYWPGGPFTCKGKGFAAGWDCGMMCFNQAGVCIGAVNAGGAMVEETMTFPNLPPGRYYIYCGWHMCNAYDSPVSYAAGAGSEFASTGMTGTPTSGVFYKVKQEGGTTPGHAYECCFVGYVNPGIPFQQAAKAGEKSGKTKGGKATKIMSSQKKAKFFCSCDNPTAERGATGVQFRGVSKRKFKQKYVDIATGENMTAEVIGTDFCKNYDPGFKQIFKCTMKPKGRFKKMDNVKSKCIIDCIHDAGVNASSQKVNFYANLDKKKKS